MSDDTLPKFVRVPSGEFIMGSDEGEEDERPAHRVSLDAFEISAHEITTAQYAQFIHTTGHPAPAIRDLPRVVTPAHETSFRDLAAPYAWRGNDPPRDRERHPVVLVRYNDALAYCVWLSERIARPVRLPTEAEWERAARGGIDGRRYPWGDGIDPSRANFLPDPALKRLRGTKPVGSYDPNGFNVYDVVGNVWEWVSDWYPSDSYRHGDFRNPRGPASGTLRLVRGGSWVTHDVHLLRCAHRHKVPPDTYTYSIGFRVAYSAGENV